MSVRIHGGPALSTLEVAERLRVGRDQARNLIESGLLAGFSISVTGRPVWRVLPESIDAFVKQQRPKILA